MFWEKTQNYDVGNDGDDRREDPVGFPPAVMGRTTIGGITPAPMTPQRQRRPSSRTVSIASTTDDRNSASVGGTSERADESETMPPLVNYGTATKAPAKPLPNYVLPALQLSPPPMQSGVDFSSWLIKPNAPSADTSPANNEASQFRIETKTNGKEGLFDSIGEIEWITGEDQSGAHYTTKTRRAYRHVTGYCAHCMD